MKIKNNIFIKSVFICIFVLLFAAILDRAYGYQIEYHVIPKEELNWDWSSVSKSYSNFPEMIYRKQVGAFKDTISKYNSGYNGKRKADGWVYTKDLNSSTYPGDDKYTRNDDPHNNSLSFERIYEYFHKYQNSGYTTDPDDAKSKGLTKRYYGTGDLSISQNLMEQAMAKKEFWNVYNETPNYSGVYWTIASSNNIAGFREDIENINNIVIMNNNAYRFGVVNSVFISDNLLGKDTVAKIWSKFSDNNSSEVLRIYGSSILRTSSENAKNNEPYYQNMDTAYKFWESTVRGSNSARNNWTLSPTTVGGTTSSPQASRSVINYYDNTYVFPKVPPQKIYVRHIDVSGVEEIKSQNITNSMVLDVNNGQAIIHDPDYDTAFSGYQPPTDRSRLEGGYKFSEYYEKVNPKVDWRIGNIKYYIKGDAKYGTMSYLNPKARDHIDGFALTVTESNVLDGYSCIGAVIGKGKSLNGAISNKNAKLASKTFRTYSGDDGAYIGNKNETGSIIKGGDYANAIISQGDKIDDSEYIVIDFYYEKNRTEQEVYVRHIDVTDFRSSITSSKVDKAISEGKVLEGRGKATRNPGNSSINKLNKIVSGYQEIYRLESGYTLTIRRDELADGSDADYECIGSNVIEEATADLALAKKKMDNKLNSSNKYNSIATDLWTVPVNGPANEVIVIDFYYVNKNTGTVITRDKKGRLAFYTTSASSAFSSYVNNHTSTNSATVYDVIASNEVIKPSIDNAYLYMLGAINIQEQRNANVYTLTYTIEQPYELTYWDWSSYCTGGCGKTSSKKKEGSCTNTYRVPVACDDPKKSGCTEIVDCNGTWIASHVDATSSGRITKTYTYNIPYLYKWYKVKNMRLYTINKVELYDGYSDNNGLPLFDGRTHTFTPTDNYKNSFKEAAFTESSFSIVPSKTVTTLDTTHTATYRNYDGDMTSSEINEQVRTLLTNNINNLFNESRFNNGNESLSLVAKIKSMDKAGNLTYYTAQSDILNVEFTLKNDQIYLKDKTTNRDIYIVGDNSKDNVDEKNEGKDYYINRSSTEYQTIKKIDMSIYPTSTKKGITEEIFTEYPKSVSSKYMPSNSTTSDLTTKEHFNEEKLSIPESRLNGKYYSYAKIYYNLLTDNKNLNFDVNGTVPDSSHGSHDWNSASNRTAVTGAKGNPFKDTEMSKINNPNSTDTTYITRTSLPNITFEYGKDNASDADIVDVFTPISYTTQIISNTASDKNTIVDHTTINNNVDQSKQIQKNSEFTIEMRTTQNSKYSNINTSKYLLQYYIKYNFDVQDIKIYDAQNSSGRNYSAGYVSANTWIGPIYNKYNGNYASGGVVKIKAFALADPNQSALAVNQETNSYEVRAVSTNAPLSLIYDVSRARISETLITYGQNSFSGTGSNNRDHNSYYTQKNIYGQSNYVANRQVDTENINRVYDFKVTDLKDVDWKNIFRKSTATSTNIHSGNAYYSGIKKWNIYTTNYNDLVERTTSEIGATRQLILPLGPYKNTNTTYIKAPKLGYKFSFDLKTTGANSNKRIVITPSFYYIGKNGNGYKENIKLLYKNSNNKYVDISNYKLYFVPDDGYRLTFKGTDEAYRFSSSSMVKSSTALGTATGIVLTDRMMQQSDNSFVQIWYGEYKLPNSTIVVETDGAGNYNPNNRLTNGYIGVKFTIEVEEYNGSSIKRKLNYAQDNKNATPSINTSQWDYEGYLGFSKPGNAANNIKIALEKGTWTLDNNMYNRIKGTVILYDTDAKASSDYD